MVLSRIDYTKLKNGTRVRVTVSQRMAREDALVTRVWEGNLLETVVWTLQHAREKWIDVNKVGLPRAIRIHAAPYVGENTYCLKCGQSLERDSARVFGYGPGCAERLGIPIEDDVSDEIVQTIKDAIYIHFSRDLWVEIDGSEIEILEESHNENGEDSKSWDARFWIEENKILVATTPDFRMAMRSIPGWDWDYTARVWKYPATPSIAVQLKKIFDGYKRVGTKEFVALIQNGESRAEAQELKTREDLPPCRHIKNGGGWQHQRAGFAYLTQILTGKNPYEENNNETN